MWLEHFEYFRGVPLTFNVWKKPQKTVTCLIQSLRIKFTKIQRCLGEKIQAIRLILNLLSLICNIISLSSDCMFLLCRVRVPDWMHTL